MRRLVACVIAGGLLASAASAQPSPLPPALPGPAAPAAPPATPPAMPANPEGLPTTPGVPFDPAKVKWPEQVNGKTISAVVGDLKSADPTVQEAALKMVQQFGPEAARKSAMRQVLAMVDDPDPGIRTNAVLLIGFIGFDNSKDFTEAVAKLKLLIEKALKGSILRLHATRTLANLGPDAHTAIPVLCAAADDPSWEVRAAVADALGRLGAATYKQTTVMEGPAAVKVPVLDREASSLAMQKLNFVLIKDASSAVRMEACQALVTLGPPHSADPKLYQKVSQPYIDAIASRLRQEKEPVVKVWLNLLHMMYDERVFDSTLKLLVADVNSGDTPVRLQAMAALTLLGPKCLPALDAVAKALRSSGTPVQVGAIQTMLAMGEHSAKTVLPELDRFVTECGTDPKLKDIRGYAELAAKALRKNARLPDPAAAPTPPAVAKP